MQHRDPFFHNNRSMNRRSFLKMSGLLGLGMASATVFPVSAEAVRFNRKLYKVSGSQLAMGTFVSMTLFHESKNQAEAAMGRAYEEIDRLSKSMNRFDGSTAIAQLNQDGRLRDIPPEMYQVIVRALEYHRITHGTFDITVKPVIDLFRNKFTGKNKGVPSENELEALLTRVGSHKIKLAKGSIVFQDPGMGITLDGIAKGYIVDKASECLLKQGISNHLINAGGDIRTMGSKSDKKPWTVAIQDPSKKKNYPDIIQMRDGAIATSGNYEIYFDQEKMFHHIVDPKTGCSPVMSTSVSVLARMTMEADALSTSVFVMGPARGTAFINSLPHCECLVLARDGNQLKSIGWKRTAI